MEHSRNEPTKNFIFLHVVGRPCPMRALRRFLGPNVQYWSLLTRALEKDIWSFFDLFPNTRSLQQPHQPNLVPWKCRYYVFWKRRNMLIILHGVRTQKTYIHTLEFVDWAVCLSSWCPVATRLAEQGHEHAVDHSRHLLGAGRHWFQLRHGT